MQWRGRSTPAYYGRKSMQTKLKSAIAVVAVLLAAGCAAMSSSTEPAGTNQMQVTGEGGGVVNNQGDQVINGKF